MTRRALVLVLVTLVGAGTLGVIWVGRWLTRSAPYRVGAPPGELKAEAVVLRSQSGSTVHGWFSGAGNRSGAILLLPPLRANRLTMVRRAKFLHAAGYSTLLIDFQGTGESDGSAITFGWRERFDVLAAVQFLREGLPGEPVGIIGASLGGAAALLATPPLDVEGIVLEAVYPTIGVAIENRLRMRMGGAGALLAPLLLWQLRPGLGVAPSQLRPVDHVSQVRGHVLIIGGVEDRHTTAADTRLLYDAARDPKQIWLIPAAGHVDYFDAVGDEYRRRVLQFFATAF